MSTEHVLILVKIEMLVLVEMGLGHIGSLAQDSSNLKGCNALLDIFSETGEDGEMWQAFKVELLVEKSALSKDCSTIGAVYHALCALSSDWSESERCHAKLGYLEKTTTDYGTTIYFQP